MKKTNKIILVFLNIFFIPCYGSDDPESIKCKAEILLSRYSPSSLRYLLEEPSNNISTQTQNGETPPNNVMDINTFAQRGYIEAPKFRKDIFHTFQSTIATISSLYKKFENDSELLWIFAINPIEIKRQNGENLTIPTQGTTTIKNKTVNNSLIYQLNCQRHKVLNAYILDFLTISKRLLFSSNNPNDYYQIMPVVRVLITTLINDVRKLKSQKIINQDYVSIMELSLEEIHYKLSCTIIDNIENKTKSNKIKEYCVSYLDSYNKLKDVILKILSNFENIDLYEKELKDTYTEFMKNRQFKLSPNRTITFTSHIFDFEKLFKTNTSIDENVNQKTPKQSKKREKQAHSLNIIKPSIIKEGKETTQEIKKSETETTKDSEIQELKETEEETIDYSDPSYWAKENAYHQERKRKVQESSDNNAPLPLSDYEKNLFWFLTNYIFSHKFSPKASELEKLLKDLQFKLEPIKGYGSVRKVSPTKNNPLFGANENYKDAYFNVHWFSDNPIVPYAYYDFIQSGFTNVFGLSREDVAEKLKPIQK